MRRAAGLVGHHRHAHRPRDLGQALAVPARDRLLDEIQVEGLERADGLERRRAIPALVGVDAERDVGPHGLAQPPDPLDVVGDRVRGCLDLEDAVALRHLLARLGDLRVGALHRERPREGHAFAHTPAEQAMHGNAERLAVQVPERHLDRGARERIALHALGHLAAHGFDPCRVASDEPRRDVALDRHRDGF